MLPSVESWKQSAHNTQRYNSFCENQLVAPDAQRTCLLMKKSSGSHQRLCHGSEPRNESAANIVHKGLGSA